LELDNHLLGAVVVTAKSFGRDRPHRNGIAPRGTTPSIEQSFVHPALFFVKG
jgi:hypothetical protein